MLLVAQEPLVVVAAVGTVAAVDIADSSSAPWPRSGGVVTAIRRAWTRRLGQAQWPLAALSTGSL